MMGADAHLFERVQQARNLTTGLIEALFEQIDSGELLPGQRLPTERAIVAATGVSRTVVREALASLRARGLIVTRQGLGAFVADEIGALSASPIVKEEGASGALQILEFRLAIEPEAAALAAERRSETELRRLRDAIEAVSVAIISGESGDDADCNFHHTILFATRNPFFPHALMSIRRSRGFAPAIAPRAMARARSRYLRTLHNEHTAILDAVNHQDAEAARRATRRHLLSEASRFRDAAAVASLRP